MEVKLTDKYIKFNNIIIVISTLKDFYVKGFSKFSFVCTFKNNKEMIIPLTFIHSREEMAKFVKPLGIDFPI